MTAAGRFDFRSPSDFFEKAGELGLKIPYLDDPVILLKPVTLSGRKLKNRLVTHPMEGADAELGGGPGELTFRRYERFARGGAGMIWFEAAAVVPEGRSNPRQLRLTAENLDVSKRLVERTRKAARTDGESTIDPFLILQLTHSGRFSKPAGIPAPDRGSSRSGPRPAPPRGRPGLSGDRRRAFRPRRSVCRSGPDGLVCRI